VVINCPAINCESPPTSRVAIEADLGETETSPSQICPGHVNEMNMPSAHAPALQVVVQLHDCAVGLGTRPHRRHRELRDNAFADNQLQCKGKQRCATVAFFLGPRISAHDAKG
jgi:hypothetical protein